MDIDHNDPLAPSWSCCLGASISSLCLSVSFSIIMVTHRVQLVLPAGMLADVGWCGSCPLAGLRQVTVAAVG